MVNDSTKASASRDIIWTLIYLMYKPMFLSNAVHSVTKSELKFGTPHSILPVHVFLTNSVPGSNHYKNSIVEIFLILRGTWDLIYFT